jgi:two-component system, OmpR family, sensor histidine kinase ChvG
LAYLLRPKRGIKLSLQVVSLIVILGAVPWVGYQFISEAKQFLDAGQMLSQEQFGRSVANTFYNDQESLSLSITADDALPKTYLSTPIALDGATQDWHEQNYQSVLFPRRQTDLGLGYTIAMGERNGDMYGLIEVRDADPDFDSNVMLGFDTRDHLRFTWRNADDKIERVVLVPQQEGVVAMFRVDRDWRRDMVDKFVRVPITAATRPKAGGYVVEFKISLSDMNDKQEIRFSVYDGTTRSGISSMGSSNKFHRLNTRSSAANVLLERLSKTVSHIALYDTDFHLRAQTQARPRALIHDDTRSLWERFMGVVDEGMMVLLHVTMGIAGDEVESQRGLLVAAMLGDVAQARWSSLNGGGFLATASPVLSDHGVVIGIVLVKQSTDEILKLQLKSLQNIMLFSVMGILLVFSTVFFLFWRLAYRVRKLRIETTLMVNTEGKLMANKLVSQVDQDDSIGDLARSFSDVVSKLHEQQSFMSTMPRTLSHEIKNPLNAISTSLEVISDYPLDEEIKSYTDIAKRGLYKIESILAKLSSAANLEQALTNDEVEPLDLNHFLTLYCQHQDQSAGGDIEIKYVEISNPAMVEAVDYRLEQALDKLLDNAKDFYRQGTPITVRLCADKFYWRIEVENQGELINPDETDQLFRSMVTSRTQATAGGAGHFGLGLYVVQTIARFHKGSAHVVNLADGSGVCFSIKLPALLI